MAIALGHGDLNSLSKDAKRIVNRDRDLRISPMAVLELEFLYEIRRVRISREAALETLAREFGLCVCDLPFEAVARQAAAEAWTRDPFDRIIVAQARLAQAILITRDTTMHAQYAKALG